MCVCVLVHAYLEVGVFGCLSFGPSVVAEKSSVEIPSTPPILPSVYLGDAHATILAAVLHF